MNLEEFFSSLQYISSGSVIDPEIIIWRVLFSFVFGIVISIISFITYTGNRYEKSVIHSQMMITVVAAVIINVVGASITYGLGLFAALSFIRFRSTIRDPKDSSVFFFSAAIGMSVGAGYFALAIIGMVTMTLILLILRFLPIFEMSYSIITFHYEPPELKSEIPEPEIELAAQVIEELTPLPEKPVFSPQKNVELIEISHSKYLLMVKDMVDLYMRENKIKFVMTAISVNKNKLTYRVTLPLEKAFSLGENIHDKHSDLISGFSVDLDVKK